MTGPDDAQMHEYVERYKAEKRRLREILMENGYTREDLEGVTITGLRALCDELGVQW